MKAGFVVVTVALIGAAALGLFLAFQNPAFLVALLSAVATHIVTAVLPKIAKRMPEADEGRMREAKGRGLEWDNARKRPRDL